MRKLLSAAIAGVVLAIPWSTACADAVPKSGVEIAYNGGPMIEMIFVSVITDPPNNQVVFVLPFGKKLSKQENKLIRDFAKLRSFNGLNKPSIVVRTESPPGN